MRPLPTASKLALVISAILLAGLFTLLYVTRADALTAEERWKALPVEEKRQEWAASCMVSGIPAGPFRDAELVTSIIKSCTDGALRLYPEPAVE